MGFLVTLPRTPASFSSFRFPGAVFRKIVLSFPGSRIFVHFKDSDKIYGPFDPGREKRGYFLPIHRRGLPVPDGFYIPTGRRSLRLSEKQEEMLLSDLAGVNRRSDLPDVVSLHLSGRILTVQVTGFRPAARVGHFRYPVDLDGLKRCSADVLSGLRDYCLRRKRSPGPSEDRLRTAGIRLFRKLFRSSELADYFRSRKGAYLSFFLSPELFFLPLELAAADDFFCLTYPMSRLSAASVPGSSHSRPDGKEFVILSAPRNGSPSFCRTETKILSDLAVRTRKSATFISLTRKNFETAYCSSRQVHFVGHGTVKNQRFLWQSENRLWSIDPSAGTRHPVPEFVFSSACNPGYFSSPFSAFISGLLDAGLKTWISPMTEIPREGSDFIKEFYSRLFRGKSCGEALLLTRRESRENGDPDWPVFGLCGDPCYRFSGPEKKS